MFLSSLCLSSHGCGSATPATRGVSRTSLASDEVLRSYHDTHAHSIATSPHQREEEDSCMMLLTLPCRGGTRCSMYCCHRMPGTFGALLPRLQRPAIGTRSATAFMGAQFSYEMKAKDKGAGKIPRGGVCPDSAPAALDINPPSPDMMACCFSRRASKMK
ncbi:hypothetical protein HDV57DRAFT_426172 [Trichoderma longibrachiatum]|uniref:Uncharacterized protein n=1 Tax=Trichoderma longibrachiatum ATCC 18648 TaxID=983965 RepID=A0A2T4CF83_TRILO|nr:hypothetical protein M440DRAFT_1119297 [Trichoderma longibrachiatum ATCC 18648]